MSEVEERARSREAVHAYRERIEGLGLWNGLWLGGMAISGARGWNCFVVRAILTAPGVRVPSEKELFELNAKHVRVRGVLRPLDDLWKLLERVVEHDDAPMLSEIFGVDVGLPTGKTPPTIRADSYSRTRDGRSHISLHRYASHNFHDTFGFELFERLGPQLKAHRPAYAGTKEVTDNLLLLGGSGLTINSASPTFEVSAEVPVSLLGAFYNRAHKAIELGVLAGSSVPLERITVSLTPTPRETLTGLDFEISRRKETLELRKLISCEEPTSTVSVHLQFDDVELPQATVEPPRESSSLSHLFEDYGEQEAWANVLEREFHCSRVALLRRLRAVLPPRVAALALDRIADSIRMRESFPFFAVVSAASVAELLLKERIAKVKKSARLAAWADLRAVDNSLSKKLPPDLRFDQAIRFANELGLVGDIDSTALDLLRVARNEVHLDRDSRPPKEDFSPVRASGAVLATLDLSKQVAARRNPKRKPKPPTVP